MAVFVTFRGGELSMCPHHSVRRPFLGCIVGFFPRFPGRGVAGSVDFVGLSWYSPLFLGATA